ncbi:MAG TPA: hypothetical protein VGM10_04980 [Actinocrinis sp.]|jgi:hypothetical protein
MGAVAGIEFSPETGICCVFGVIVTVAVTIVDVPAGADVAMPFGAIEVDTADCVAPGPAAPQKWQIGTASSNGPPHSRQ